MDPKSQNAKGIRVVQTLQKVWENIIISSVLQGAFWTHYKAR